MVNLAKKMSKTLKNGSFQIRRNPTDSNVFSPEFKKILLIFNVPSKDGWESNISKKINSFCKQLEYFLIGFENRSMRLSWRSKKDLPKLLDFFAKLEVIK